MLTARDLSAKYSGLLSLTHTAPDSDLYASLTATEIAVRSRLTSDTAVVLYSAAHVFRGTQLQLYFDEGFPGAHTTICLALLNAELVPQALYTLPVTEWRALPIVKRCFKVLHLDRLRNLDAPEKACALSSSREALVIEEMPVEQAVPQEPLALPIEPLQFADYLLCEERGDAAPLISQAWYTQWVIDATLVMTRYRALADQTVEAYRAYYLENEGYEHYRCALSFLTGIVYAHTHHHKRQKTEEKRTYRLHSDLDVRHLKLWIDAEMLFWRRLVLPGYIADPSTLDALEHTLSAHIRHIQAELPRRRCSNWHTFALDGDRYWRRAEDGTYVVRFEWSLLVPRLASLPHQGLLSLQSGVFFEFFLPALYQAQLRDVFDCVFFFCEGSRTYARELRSLAPVDETLVAALPALNDAAALWDFCEQYGLTSSVTMERQMIQMTEAVERAPIVEPLRPRMLERRQLTDIEDLVSKKVMPPCLQGILTPVWLKNLDRLNAIHYLMDLGYARDEIVAYMCRDAEHDNACDREAIVANYNYLMTKKERKDQRTSLACGAVINFVPKEKDILFRCPYEARLNGTQRRKHTHEEKDKMMCACSETIVPRPVYRISHPLDYVAHVIESK